MNLRRPHRSTTSERKRKAERERVRELELVCALTCSVAGNAVDVRQCQSQRIMEISTAQSQSSTQILKAVEKMLTSERLGWRLSGSWCSIKCAIYIYICTNWPDRRRRLNLWLDTKSIRNERSKWVGSFPLLNERQTNCEQIFFLQGNMWHNYAADSDVLRKVSAGKSIRKCGKCGIACDGSGSQRPQHCSIYHVRLSPALYLDSG